MQCVAVADKKHLLSARVTVCETSSRASPAFPFHLRVLHQQQQENGTNRPLEIACKRESDTYFLGRLSSHLQPYRRAIVLAVAADADIHFFLRPPNMSNTDSPFIGPLACPRLKTPSVFLQTH